MIVGSRRLRKESRSRENYSEHEKQKKRVIGRKRKKKIMEECDRMRARKSEIRTGGSRERAEGIRIETKLDDGSDGKRKKE